MGVLTVRENIAFSAELRLPTSLGRAEKKRRIDDTIDLLVRMIPTRHQTDCRAYGVPWPMPPPPTCIMPRASSG